MKDILVSNEEYAFLLEGKLPEVLIAQLKDADSIYNQRRVHLSYENCNVIIDNLCERFIHEGLNEKGEINKIGIYIESLIDKINITKPGTASMGE